MDVITFPENLYTTSGLSILLHGVISLLDVIWLKKLFSHCYMISILNKLFYNVFPIKQ